ncbi:LysR substrate-binding domain-containing protein [Methylobacterium durans]|uniref:LysR family transcriptional regulator n=1 Tax=Methylobacterium durans TaxID=2202825 RepID=A0A2U8W858_9HYPH|nr:LysR substrate-binding domain-containing protein [Methylobacterium durans]AWN42307.1 LysR family transcriptional regulator [Methylobacterium durans]
MPLPRLPFDLDLLRTLVAIVDNGSFTRAARRMGLTQSTVSLQIKRLEDGLGQRLFDRDGRDVRLTPEGEILLNYARQILRLGSEARSRIMEPDVTGVVRLGTPEDFATTHLAEILARFARSHPQVALEVNCDYTVNLIDDFSKGHYDLILFKREPQGPGGGIQVWREVLDWAASPRLLLTEHDKVPLVLAPAPDVYRKRALSALDVAQRLWRIVYTSPSLAGLQAAVQAGLGVTVLPTEMVPAGLISVSTRLHLPKLPDTEIVLYRAPGSLSPAAELLALTIVASLEQHRCASR